MTIEEIREALLLARQAMADRRGGVEIWYEEKYGKEWNNEDKKIDDLIEKLNHPFLGPGLLRSIMLDIRLGAYDWEMSQDNLSLKLELYHESKCSACKEKSIIV